MSATDADTSDWQGLFQRDHLQLLSQEWPPPRHQGIAQTLDSASRMPVGPCAYSDPFDFQSGPPQLEAMFFEPDENKQPDAGISVWSGMTTGQPRTPSHQDRYSSLWSSPIGQSYERRTVPEMREIGSWTSVSVSVDDTMELPSAALMYYSTENAATSLDTLIDPDQTQRLQTQLFIRAPARYQSLAEMHNHDLPTPRQPSYSEGPTQTTKSMRHASVVLEAETFEGVFEASTGETKRLPERKRQRPRNQRQRHNRDLIRRLGGACPSCKERKRKV